MKARSPIRFASRADQAPAATTHASKGARRPREVTTFAPSKSTASPTTIAAPRLRAQSRRAATIRRGSEMCDHVGNSIAHLTRGPSGLLRSGFVAGDALEGYAEPRA